MDFKKAQNYWKEKAADSVQMDRTALQKKIEEYITENNTCALATGTGGFIRNTPIEYSYHDGCFWIFSEGGEKFIGLEENPNIRIMKTDDEGKIRVSIKASPNAMEYWAMQYISHVEIISPVSLRECIRESLEDGLNRYSK